MNKKRCAILAVVVISLCAVIAVMTLKNENMKIKTIASNDRYTLQQVKNDQMQPEDGISYTYHDGSDGKVYLMKLNITNGRYFYTEALYEYDYATNTLHVIKTFDPYTRIFDLKAKNQDELYYTKIDHHGDKPYNTYEVVKLKDGKEDVQDSGKVEGVLRTSSLEMVNGKIVYLKENMEPDQQRYVLHVKQEGNKEALWEYIGSLKNYLFDQNDENFNEAYITASDNSFSYFTRTKDSCYFYYENDGDIKRKQYNKLIEYTITTENYHIVAFEDGYEILNKDSGEITKKDEARDFARHCYISEDTFAALEKEKVVIYSVKNGKLQSYTIDEIPNELDIELVRIDTNKIMIVSHKYDQDADKLYDDMYILTLKG